MKTLVYVGAYHGHGARPFVEQHHRAILFEPNPSCASHLRERFAMSHRRVELVQAAVGPIDGGLAQLRLYGQQAGSASVLPISEAAATAFQIDRSAAVVNVKTVRLDEELRRREVETITTLVTDAQGMDLEVLHQVRPWLEKGIETIQCEVDALEFRCYVSDRGNDILGFDTLLSSLPVKYRRKTEVTGAHIDMTWELVR